MNTGFQLYQLQQIDSEIDAAEKRINEIDSLIKSDREVQTAKAAYDKSQEIYKKMKTSFDLLDDEIQAKKVKKSQSESNLYGGKVKNPKELQDLQQEISSLGSIIARLEDDLLERLITLEDAEKQATGDKQKLDVALTDFESRKSLLKGEKAKLERTVSNLETKKESLINQIDQSSLDIYQSLRKSKGGTAVSQLQDESCSECGTHLTPSQCQQARSASVLFYCPGCRRIVYGS